MSVLWRESWASMANSYLAAGSSERIDHRSLQAQHEEALEKAAAALDNEEQALWLAKAAETNRPAMKRIHSAKWRSKAAQEQRAAEQAVRDAAKQEAVEVYKTFSELDLEIVVDVRSFTITHLAEPEEIVLPKTSSSSSTNEIKDLFWLHQLLILVCVALNLTVIKQKSVRLLLVRNHQSVFLILVQILF
jgi:hypothetical protein